MIDLGDLMLKNLVIDRRSKKVCEVTQVGEFVRLDGIISYWFKKDLDPVVVTEKILLGFGFRRVELICKSGNRFTVAYTRPGTKYFITWECEGPGIDTKRFCICMDTVLDGKPHTVKKPVKSEVHLLQNGWKFFTEQKLEL